MADEYRKQLDMSIPSTERQVELEAVYAQQQGTDAPYQYVEIRTHGELQWIMQQRHWSGVYPLPTGMQRANLSGADFDEANLRGATLREANLQGADLHRAVLSEADLYGADLSEADLHTAHSSSHQQRDGSFYANM